MTLGEKFALGTGLLENENVWIQQTTFSYDADYNKGQSLCLVAQAQCEDSRTEKVLLPVGDGWEPGPGGEELRREDGSTTRPVQKTSAYGQFIDSVLKLTEGNPGLLQALEATEGVKHASWLRGMGFHVARKEESWTINGERRTSQRLIADAFLGVAGQGVQAPPAPPPAPVAPSPVAAPAPVAPPAAAPVPLQPVASPGVALTPPPPAVPVAAPVAAAPQPAVASAPPETVAALTAIAKSVPDHSTWMTSAFPVPGVMGNSALEAAIIDTSENGLFLRLRAS